MTKVAVASTGNNKQDLVAPHFGRCPFFFMVDTEKEEFNAVKNQAQKAFGGAGISAAQLVVDSGAEAIISKNIGPKAVSVLTQSNIGIYLADEEETVEQAIKSFEKGNLKKADEANVSMGRGGMSRR
jgi:predicted Fe-Mo cluster-binding NifX family protein